MPTTNNWRKEFEEWYKTHPDQYEHATPQEIAYWFASHVLGGEGIAEWQLCPKCQGQGRVCKPPYLGAEVQSWSATQTDWECGVCHGAKILQRPYVNAPAREVKLGEQEEPVVTFYTPPELPSSFGSASFDQIAKELYPLVDREHYEGQITDWMDMRNEVDIQRPAYIRGLKECMPLIEALRIIVSNGMRQGVSGQVVYSIDAKIASDAIAAFPTPDKPEDEPKAN